MQFFHMEGKIRKVRLCRIFRVNIMHGRTKVNLMISYTYQSNLGVCQVDFLEKIKVTPYTGLFLHYNLHLRTNVTHVERKINKHLT